MKEWINQKITENKLANGTQPDEVTVDVTPTEIEQTLEVELAKCLFTSSSNVMMFSIIS